MSNRYMAVVVQPLHHVEQLHSLQVQGYRTQPVLSRLHEDTQSTFWLGEALSSLASCFTQAGKKSLVQSRQYLPIPPVQWFNKDCKSVI